MAVEGREALLETPRLSDEITCVPVIRLILSVVIVVGIGVWLGIARSGAGKVIVVSVVLFVLSYVSTYYDVMFKPQEHWLANLLDGLLQTGLLSIVLHVCPLVPACCITRVVRRRPAA